TCRPSPATTYQRCGLPRRAFAVFEYDGPAWSKIAEGLRQQMAALAPGQTDRSGISAQMLQGQIDFGSRLVPVDASMDPAALRRAYPDRPRDLILPVVITANSDLLTEANRAAGPPVRAQLTLATPTLVVPSQLRASLADLQPSEYGGGGRYAVSLAVGRRHE